MRVGFENEQYLSSHLVDMNEEGPEQSVQGGNH